MESFSPIRCAIYTRKSTDEGLEKEFNTLEAQREAGENYIRSMKHQGWVIPWKLLCRSTGLSRQALHRTYLIGLAKIFGFVNKGKRGKKM